MRTYYIASFSDGSLRLFASKADAEAFESAADGRFIVDAIESPEGEHYRGKPPRRGVAFTPEDASTPQIYAAMANR